MLNIGLLVVICLTFAITLWVTGYHKNKLVMGVGISFLVIMGLVILSKSYLYSRSPINDIAAIEELAQQNGYRFDSNNRLVMINPVNGADDEFPADNVPAPASVEPVSGSGERVRTVDRELHFMSQMPALRSSTRKHSKSRRSSHK